MESLVSIIIPSFNQGHFIDETINSILNQSYRPIEVIIVDGGSQDCTLSVLEKYKTNKLVSWVSEKDQGHWDAVNKGFGRAKGNIVAWLNSDDVYFYRNSIEVVVENFERFPDVDVIYGDAAIISETSHILRIRLVPPYKKERILRSNMITQPSVFFRKRVTDSEPLEKYIGLDYEYWLRLADKGFRFLHVNQILAGDRQYGARLSVRKKKELRREKEELDLFYGHKCSKKLTVQIEDYSFQAFCRLKGILSVFDLCFSNNLEKELAFPGKIDSIVRLGTRQIFRSITQVS